jgi:hypothetical protein
VGGFSQVLAAAQTVIFLISDFVIHVLSGVDRLIRSDLTILGLPGYQQTMIVASLAILTVIASVRILNGVARSAFIVVVLLLVMRVLIPTLQG